MLLFICMLDSIKFKLLNKSACIFILIDIARRRCSPTAVQHSLFLVCARVTSFTYHHPWWETECFYFLTSLGIKWYRWRSVFRCVCTLFWLPHLKVFFLLFLWLFSQDLCYFPRDWIFSKSSLVTYTTCCIRY